MCLKKLIRVSLAGNVNKLSSLPPSIIASSYSLSGYSMKTISPWGKKPTTSSPHGWADNTNRSHSIKIGKEMVVIERKIRSLLARSRLLKSNALFTPLASRLSNGDPGYNPPDLLALFFWKRKQVPSDVFHHNKTHLWIFQSVQLVMTHRTWYGYMFMVQSNRSHSGFAVGYG